MIRTVANSCEVTKPDISDEVKLEKDRQEDKQKEASQDNLQRSFLSQVHS
jgi:hypothetical protein